MMTIYIHYFCSLMVLVHSNLTSKLTKWKEQCYNECSTRDFKPVNILKRNSAVLILSKFPPKAADSLWMCQH